MPNIATSIAAFTYPPQSYMDRHGGGYLEMLYKQSGGNFGLAETSDLGTTWSTHLTLTRSNIQEWSSIYIDNNNYLHWAYRTNEGSQDRIYYRRCDMTGSSAVWQAEVLTGSPSNGGVAGAVHTGLDLTVVISGGVTYVAIAAGTTLGANTGVTLYGVTISPSGTQAYNNGIIKSTRQWLSAGTGRQTPSIDIEHNGDGKTSGVPHLWVGYGRTDVRLVKLAWSGSGWTGPSSPVVVQSGLTAQDAMTGRWDGSRFLMAVPDPSSTSKVRVLERNQANSTTTIRTTPTHPTGVVRNCTVAYDPTNGDMRVYAVGTSTTVLYFVHYTRATGSWGAWAQVLATAVDGTTGERWGTRRNTYGNSRWDVYTAHSGAPNSLVHTQLGAAYPPSTPTWDYGAIGYNNGNAADVDASLVLDWDFNDADTNDTQSAYALSRQIGAGALQYFRASDSTWQATEQKNTSATTSRTLASGWGAGTDANHTYRVKTWDSTDQASGYSEGFTVVPSVKVNPTITSPTEAGTITSNNLTLTWTVAEQTAYRVRLQILSEVLYDSGWITSTDTTTTIPYGLTDGFNYSAFLTTRNLEGLQSNEVQRNFSVDFTEPAHASTVATPSTTNGRISVAITNPAPAGTQPTFVSQDLWRRVVSNAILNANPTFETDLTGWGTAVGGTAVRTNTQAKFGTWSYQLTPNGVAADAYVESVKIPCDPSTSYHADGWIRAALATKPVAVFIRWYTSGDVFISESKVTVTPLAANAWFYYGPIATSPSNAAKLTVCAGVHSTPTTSHIIWADELRVRKTDGSEGTPVAVALQSDAVFEDWTAIHGVNYEYRSIVSGSNGTISHGPWQG